MPETRYKIETFSIGPIETNTYVLSDDKHAIVIDPAFDNNDLKKSLTGKHVEAVIFTHNHLDHTMGFDSIASLVKDSLIIMHYDDQKNLDNKAATGAELFGVEVPHIEINKIIAEEKCDFEINNLQLRFLHTPGHTPGSMSIYLPQMDCMFTGDTIFAGGRGRTDMYGGSESQILNSIRMILGYNDKCILYPGHGPETYVMDEREYY